MRSRQRTGPSGPGPVASARAVREVAEPVSAAGGGMALQPEVTVQGWPVPLPPLLAAGSLPCVHQLAV